MKPLSIRNPQSVIRHGPSRRQMLQCVAGVLGASASGWFGQLAAWGAAQGSRHKSCILLWLDGGPSQAHTFDVKPEGQYKTIHSAVPGIDVSEYLPRIAGQMKHMALLRSMSTSEADHQRARYLMHTGYRLGGAVIYPGIGAIACRELAQPDFELPNFIVVGDGRRVPRAGYLGPQYNPLVVADPAKGVDNLKPADPADIAERAGLVGELDQDFLRQYQAGSIEAHKKSYQGAVRMMLSPKAKAFEVGDEPASLREAYGAGRFGNGCLVARRLVEVGVPFVEVMHPDNWDHHSGAAGPVKELSGSVDAALATLVADLKDRGLLDRTLVICMGEFGRTPISGGGHYPRAWTTLLAGGGLKLGQVVGRTDKKGATVEERPISAPDFIATLCKALEIDWTKSYQGPGNRPIKMVDKDAKPVQELFG